MTDKSEHDAILAALHAFERSEKPAPFNQMKDAIEAYRAAQPRDDVRNAILDDRINVWNFVCEWPVHSEGQTLEHQKGQDYAATQIACALYEGKPDFDTALAPTTQGTDDYRDEISSGQMNAIRSLAGGRNTQGTDCGVCGGKKRIPVTTISSAPEAGWADCPECSERSTQQLRDLSETLSAFDVIAGHAKASQGVCCGSCDLDDTLTPAYLPSEENALPILEDDQTITERDQAEEMIGRMFTLVTGREPQWSNLFGFSDAYNEMDEALAALRCRPDTDGLAEYHHEPDGANSHCFYGRLYRGDDLVAFIDEEEWQRLRAALESTP